LRDPVTKQVDRQSRGRARQLRQRDHRRRPRLAFQAKVRRSCGNFGKKQLVFTKCDIILLLRDRASLVASPAGLWDSDVRSHESFAGFHAPRFTPPDAGEGWQCSAGLASGLPPGRSGSGPPTGGSRRPRTTLRSPHDHPQASPTPEVVWRSGRGILATCFRWPLRQHSSRRPGNARRPGR
jgi:hypothetical protein